MRDFVVSVGNVNRLVIMCNFALVDLWHLVIKTVFTPKP